MLRLSLDPVFLAMTMTTCATYRNMMVAFLLAATSSFCLADPAEENTFTSGDLALMQRGAVVLFHTGYYDHRMPPPGLIDGTNTEYWASSGEGKSKPYPHYFIIELDRVYAVQRLALSNVNNDEADFPGVSAREVVILGSTESDATGYKQLAKMQGKQFGRVELTLPEPVNVRWLKVMVKSNYGNKYSTELSEIEVYGKPVGDAPVHPDISGIYMTNYGLLRIDVQGKRVEGCYDLDAGYVWGTTDGRVLNINWVEHKGTEKGDAILVLASNGRFLSGLWWEKDVMMGPWYGKRVREATEIECKPPSAAAALGIERKLWSQGD